MKIKTPKGRLTKGCPVEIYRHGCYAGQGLFLRYAGTSIQGEKQARVINERGMIENIPTDQLGRIGGGQ